MAYNIGDNKPIVSELYVTDGNLINSKYVLTIMHDGKVTLKWYDGDIVIEHKNPCLVKCRNGMRVEYGSYNDSGTRSYMELMDYTTGNLAKRWEKIK